VVKDFVGIGFESLNKTNSDIIAIPSLEYVTETGAPAATRPSIGARTKGAAAVFSCFASSSCFYMADPSEHYKGINALPPTQLPQRPTTQVNWTLGFFYLQTRNAMKSRYMFIMLIHSASLLFIPFSFLAYDFVGTCL
jgi:hypothetical protein